MGLMIAKERITRPLGRNLTEALGLRDIPPELYPNNRYPVQTPTNHQVIVSASSNYLAVQKDGKQIAFSITRDRSHPRLARLSLYSEINSRPDIDFKGHAGEFFAGAIKYLNQFSWWSLIGIIADWHVDERNHTEFWSEVRQGASIERAALSTWTGQRASRLGFRTVMQIPHNTLSENSQTALIFARKKINL